MQHTKHYTLGHRKRLGKQIEEQYRQSMQHRLSQAKTIIEKREVVSQANPLFYVFGETRKVFKPYLTYEENHGIK